MFTSKALSTFLGISAALVLTACSGGNASDKSANTDAPALRWGSDENGSAPFVFRNPDDPGTRIGFEKEIADELGKRLGKQIEFVQSSWDALLPALNRGDFDFAMSGIEITDARAGQVAFTHSYYVSTKQLVVRTADTHINSLADLSDRPVGTLMESTSERYLRNTRCEVRTYDDSQHPFDDLKNGTVDGVFIDLPIAEFYARPDKELRLAGKPVAPGNYAIAVRKKDDSLLSDLNEALDKMKADGTLQEILERWNLWNDAQTTHIAPPPTSA